MLLHLGVEDRGTVTVEYVVVLVAVTLVAAIAIVAIGISLYTTFQEHVTWVLLPVP